MRFESAGARCVSRRWWPHDDRAVAVVLEPKVGEAMKLTRERVLSSLFVPALMLSFLGCSNGAERTSDQQGNALAGATEPTARSHSLLSALADNGGTFGGLGGSLGSGTSGTSGPQWSVFAVDATVTVKD